MDRVLGLRATRTLVALAEGERGQRFDLDTKVAVANRSLPGVNEGVYVVRELLEAARAVDARRPA